MPSMGYPSTWMKAKPWPVVGESRLWQVRHNAVDPRPDPDPSRAELPLEARFIAGHELLRLSEKELEQVRGQGNRHGFPGTP